MASRPDGLSLMKASCGPGSSTCGEPARMPTTPRFCLNAAVLATPATPPVAMLSGVGLNANMTALVTALDCAQDDVAENVFDRILERQRIVSGGGEPAPTMSAATRPASAAENNVSVVCLALACWSPTTRATPTFFRSGRNWSVLISTPNSEFIKTFEFGEAFGQLHVVDDAQPLLCLSVAMDSLESSANVWAVSGGSRRTVAFAPPSPPTFHRHW